jgi:hypothetical protein
MKPELIGWTVLIAFAGIGFLLGYALNKSPIIVRGPENFEREVQYLNMKHSEVSVVTQTLPDGSKMEQRREVEHEEHNSVPFVKPGMQQLVNAE